jgi:site-specific DNA recombinase
MIQSKDSLRVALYARVSSERQAQAATIASQLAALQQRIEADGHVLDAELSFIDDGYSGTSLIRPALERLRDQVANGAVDRLYVHSPDRLARKYAYQFLLMDELQRGGVEVVFLNRELGRSAEDDLLLQVQGIIAEYERTKILDRSRRGKLHAARCGSVSVFGRAPYGYRYISKHDGDGQARFQIVLDEARVVQLIFTWVGQERLSLADVCRRLQDQGIPAPRGKGRWNASTVARILGNSTYRGAAAYGKTRVVAWQPPLRPLRGRGEVPRHPYSSTRDGTHPILIAVPALVSEELFAAAAEQLAENQRRRRCSRRGASYLLQGLVVCQHCGYALHGTDRAYVTKGQQRRQYAYYRCIGRRRQAGISICQARPVHGPALDAAVWEDVCRLLQDPGKIQQEYERRLHSEPSERASEGAKALTKVIRQVQRTIARLIDAYGDGLLEKEEFEPRLRSAKERLARLQEEARVYTDAASEQEQLRLVVGKLREFSTRVREGLQGADWLTCREIVRALVKRVEVDDQKVKIVYRIDQVPLADGSKSGFWQHCPRGRAQRLRTINRRVSAAGR